MLPHPVMYCCRKLGTSNFNKRSKMKHYAEFLAKVKKLPHYIPHTAIIAAVKNQTENKQQTGFLFKNMCKNGKQNKTI